MDKLDPEDTNVNWDPVHEVTLSVNWVEWGVRNTVKLLDAECTVPFIARYRKEMTSDMDVEKIKEVKEKYEELKVVQHKIESAMKAVHKLGKLDQILAITFRNAKTITEVEHLFAPYKPGSKRTLAERARELGLDTYANKVLKEERVNLNEAVDHDKKGIKNIVEVETGIQHIIADLISKEKETMDKVRDIYNAAYIKIETCRAKETSKKTAEDKKIMKGQHTGNKQANPEKFEIYFQFSIPKKYIKPHQVLAINRGEKLKILQVKFNIPDQVHHQFTAYCENHWIKRDMCSNSRNLIQRSIEDAHKRLIEPLMIRQFRAALTQTAEKASIDVFGKNLERLLLVPPVRGKVVLGVDPGFKHGCKYAVTSATEKVLDTGVLYLHTYNESAKYKETDKLKKVIYNYGCDTVAIGNGTACRETEKYFSIHISKGTFKPNNVQYCIVNEAGASVYSASDEAIREFPDMDVSLRGAVSIARRLQDPLGELVKIEPKHLGVGMYQHDCSEAKLKASLDSVIEECVSFTGVDLNTCSEFLLRRIAGLNTAKVKKILEHREKCNGFINRAELKNIKGFGPKTFEQCAGFVRIMPETRRKTIKTEPDETIFQDDEPGKKTKKRKLPQSGAKTKSKKAKTDKAISVPNTLDMTSIHPESYHVAEKVLEKFKMNKENIGQDSFINVFKTTTTKASTETLAKEVNVGIPTMKLILDGLQQKIGHDIREEFEKPLFKQGIVSLNSIKTSDILTGKVTNNTHFGAFVDVGVETDGLIHSSKIHKKLLNGRNTLGIGDKVEVKVESLDLNRKRLGLILLKLY